MADGLKKPVSTREKISYLFLAASVLCLVLGRIETMDLTEGQAFIAGLGYWLTALGFGSVSVLLNIWEYRDGQVNRKANERH